MTRINLIGYRMHRLFFALRRYHEAGMQVDQEKLARLQERYEDSQRKEL